MKKKQSSGQTKSKTTKKVTKKVIPKKISTRELLRPIVNKAIKTIEAEFDDAEENYAIALISGKSIIIPEQTREECSAVVDEEELSLQICDRIRKRKKLFTGIVMYMGSDNCYCTKNRMCRDIREAFDDYKNINPDFLCIVANTRKEFEWYKDKEWKPKKKQKD